MSKPFDNRVLDLVRLATEQGHQIARCSDCGGPAVYSLDRLATSKCLQCGAFHGTSLPRSSEPQPFKNPYTMTIKARLARYLGDAPSPSGRVCANCRCPFQGRKSSQFCSTRCRMRAHRQAAA